MKRSLFHIHALCMLASALFLASCGQDRSGEYYALIGPKTWMYETMQQHYLFYEDLPTEEGLNFFDKPETFLQSVVSSQDQKNGSVFSHIDSVNVSRVQSAYPTFGLEGSLIRNTNGDYVVHILYVYPDSPASEVGLKRNDWVVSVNDRALNTSNFESFFQRPSSSCRYRVATEVDGQPDTSYVDMPAPRIIEQPSVFTYKTITAGNKKAFYILYNGFETDDEESLKAAFNEAAAQSPSDIILDLRYNPGGYVSTAQLLSTILAPQGAMGQPWLTMVFNDKTDPQTQTYTFDASLLQGVTNLNYDHLYVITTSNTASASEIVINTLRPYLGDKLLQVGAATFGKNVAQSLFTNEAYPQLEFWLTTSYTANSENFYDYYTDGLQPDYVSSEDLTANLGEFGTPADSILAPVFYHLEHGTFPSTGTEESTRSTGSKIIYNPIDHKPKRSQMSIK
ncbi:MAG TPA: peptidase S41 [Candidatus Phocaeicola caecigallinarum]|nr:peptidase S41 [Candidatus Phocaeicola caecigallinarum]